ncbi:ATP-dependent RecD-like DNA helicase [Ancylomarina sp. 16SWW S1-10-2]|uniref:ATP-dependent DNA helicase n=1 Tax=Ancylomarina sp. 16SWW S1-10-2 TaxID=2499681 RepID=UPI0012AD2B05|nr:ATP-binding domain-containing protein [Ancylomarina sp. 16SWW S1-10-2]MRT92684.1 ATP-dependent endonuclease [Ancylomarina sp. 16SWW S1-10-2]
MLKKHISLSICNKLKFEPTNDQGIAIDELSAFLTGSKNDSIFLLKGYAGTGKTTLISALVASLTEMEIKTVLLAPTGRAAKVLSYYCKQSAYTIHKKIYRQKALTDGFGVFNLDRNLLRDTIFLVDEASMISNYSHETSSFGSGCLLDDLVDYVSAGINCRLILVGDVAQLPPIGIDISPALDPKELESCYNFSVKEVILTQVVRQSEESGILKNATELRRMLDEGESGYPQFETKNFPDIVRLSGADLIDEISSAHYKYGLEETMVLSRSNKRANQYNQGIRNSILYREDEITVGDYLMVVKNNYFWTADVKEIDFIANGDIVEIVRIGKHVELYGYRYVEVSLRFPDYKDLELDTMIMLDTLTIETASLNYEENKKLFFKINEDYADIRSKKKRYEKVRDNKFFNALQVKFAYAITCHKAQGGQWSAVFVDQGYITEDMLNREFYRWLYTALTRATKKLYLVNFKKDFFPNEELDL